VAPRQRRLFGNLHGEVAVFCGCRRPTAPVSDCCADWPLAAGADTLVLASGVTTPRFR
jgi:hypothetical protein